MEKTKKKIPKGWVSVVEFAKLTGNSDKTIRAAIRRGVIPTVQVGSGATAPHYLNPQPAAEAWRSKLHMSHPTSRPVIAKLDQYIGTFKPAAQTDIATDVTSKTPVATYDDALFRERFAKAQLAELDLAEKSGSLIDKARVYEHFFAAGRQHRDALLAIPDRITDQVIANADNRTAVNNIIYNAISDELKRLVDVGKGL